MTLHQQATYILSTMGGAGGWVSAEVNPGPDDRWPDHPWVISAFVGLSPVSVRRGGKVVGTLDHDGANLRGPRAEFELGAALSHALEN